MWLECVCFCVFCFFFLWWWTVTVRQADVATDYNVKRPLTFCSLCSRVASRHRGVLEKQRRPATNTAEVKGRMCISACVSKKKEKKEEEPFARPQVHNEREREEKKISKNHHGSFVFTSVLTVTSPQKCINNH